MLGKAWAWIIGLGVTASFAQGQFATPDTSLLQQQITALQGAMPTGCPSVPLPDTLNGSLGSSPCLPNASATRPTVIQAANVTTDVTGAWSVTWAKAFQSATPYITAQPINTAGTQPYICNVASSTTTSASGKCWQTVTMTLPSVALNLLGLVLNPTGAASSIQVRVAARETTQ